MHEQKNLPKFNKIMSSKDQLNRTKSEAMKDITLIHINNKIKDSLNPLNRRIKKYSKKINSKLKLILSTSNIIDKAKIRSSYLKDILIKLDQTHNNNISKLNTFRKTTNDLKHTYLNIKHISKEEEKNNSIKESEKIEIPKEKLNKLLNDNILLMMKKKEIFRYYLITNKYYKFNDEKKIRYMDKIAEILEIKQIMANKLMTQKEKKAKIENNRFYISQKKRLKKEKLEKYSKMLEKLERDNELSLRNIKDTSDTLNSIQKNKFFLDEEIKLKYDHNNDLSQPPSIKRNINIDNNKKKKLIKKITELYTNRTDKTKLDSLDSSLCSNLDFIKSSRIRNYFNLSQPDKASKDQSKKSLINLKRFSQGKSTISIPKRAIKNKPPQNSNEEQQIIPNNNSINLYEDENTAKSKLNSIYEDIKKDNKLYNKDADFIRNYFLRKNAKLSKKPGQTVILMSNSLSRINKVDITKKLKKIHGVYIPDKYVNLFDNLESIDHNANYMQSAIYDSICKSKMNN